MAEQCISGECVARREEYIGHSNGERIIGHVCDVLKRHVDCNLKCPYLPENTQ